MSDDEVTRWETLYDMVVAQGTFLWTVTFFITSGRKPTGQPRLNATPPQRLIASAVTDPNYGG